MLTHTITFLEISHQIIRGHTYLQYVHILHILVSIKIKLASQSITGKYK